MPISLHPKETVAEARPDQGRPALIGVVIVVVLVLVFALSLGAVLVVTLFV